MNPYLYGPFELGNNAYTAPVDPLWGNAPAPYGPMFLQLDGFFAKVTFHNELATIVLLRLLALVGVLLIAACVPRLARLYHRDSAELFTLMVLNPVTIFHLIGGAHNDALMLGLLVAGVTLAKEKRPIWGIVLCALATAVKAPADLDGVDGSRPFCTTDGVGAVLAVFHAQGLVGTVTRAVSLNQACPAAPFISTYQGVPVECARSGADYSLGVVTPIRGDAPSTPAVPADAVTASGRPPKRAA